ncbi:MAG TPA: thiol:disulfide interchange protein, partial [Microvirga sp.]|nr:thiol:disulfide interchange protein [Microvirga sp.]
MSNVLKSRKSWLVGLAALVLAGAGATWYSLVPRDPMAAGIAECRASRPTAERLKPLAKGEVAAVGVS